MRRKTRPKPRPICPQCGSVDVNVDPKKAICNRCGLNKPRGKFFEYPQGPSGGPSRKIEPAIELEVTGPFAKRHLDKAWKGKL